MVHSGRERGAGECGDDGGMVEHGGRAIVGATRSSGKPSWCALPGASHRPIRSVKKKRMGRPKGSKIRKAKTGSLTAAVREAIE